MSSFKGIKHSQDWQQILYKSIDKFYQRDFDYIRKM